MACAICTVATTISGYLGRVLGSRWAEHHPRHSPSPSPRRGGDVVALAFHQRPSPRTVRALGPSARSPARLIDLVDAPCPDGKAGSVPRGIAGKRQLQVDTRMIDRVDRRPPNMPRLMPIAMPMASSHECRPVTATISGSS